MENNGGSGPEIGRSLIKHLACSQKIIREKALRVLLKSWLPSRSQQLPEDDVKKLWKGLFYCVWHSDKPLVQADLIDRLSSLLLILDPALSLQYFSTFFITMRREWSGIDALRLDKFYLLIRRFISKLFSLLKKNSWDLELVQCFMNLLDEATFPAQDNLKGNGVNYHVASIFLEELTPFLPVKENVLEVFFKPFFSAMGKLPDRVLLWKIKSGIFDVLVRNGKMLLEIKKKGGGDVDLNGGDVVNLGTIALVMGFSSKCFELGSAPNCLQGNRKVLFELHREFLKLEKDVEISGFKFSIPDSVDMDDEEVPNLVPIDNAAVEVDAVVHADVAAKFKKLKKCKKDKKDSVDGEKKKTKKKKKSDASDLNCEISPVVNHSENIASENGGNSNNEQVNDESTVLLNENVILNLQKQFEKIAAESGLDDGVASVCDSPKAVSTGAISKKRKRTKNLKGKTSREVDLNGGDTEETGMEAKSGEKSAKKVRFSMKNNLVWKPHSPLPPQDLRLPPSATPRGSALKKGVPPGPIREMPLQTKKPKQRKKNRKAIMGVVPAVKRVKKLKTWT